MEVTREIHNAKNLIINSQRVTVLSGAGISVESGIPPFRGPSGIWSMYDPSCLDLDYFYLNPLEAWLKIKEIFYDYFGKAQPNPAHYALAQMEQMKHLHCIITQNIDHLHHDAGSQTVIEYHGTSRELICIECQRIFQFTPDFLSHIPPMCPHCSGILKPNFVFFGENIPINAHSESLRETYQSDCWLVVGTSGEVQPAAQLPYLAKKNGAKIIEINIQPSNYTHQITDIFLKGKASEMLTILLNLLI